MFGRGKRRGNAAVEFALVGIPVIFTLISVEEISRGMWMYDTLASTVARTARYISVRGQDCACLNLGQILHPDQAVWNRPGRNTTAGHADLSLGFHVVQPTEQL